MMGGEAGARLAHAAGLPVSADTLLRLLRRAEGDEVETPRILGVDVLALRRGQRYATILVNLETSEAIDLLAGREAEPIAEWLREHLGVEVIVRGRSEAYAEGARAGTPDGVQVADRFHLVRNASAAMDELLQGRRRQIAVDVSEPPPPPPAAPAAKPVRPTIQRMAERPATRIARWEEVQRRHREGEGFRHIARELGISRVSVRRLIDTPIPPRNRVVHPRPGGLSSSSLQTYVSGTKAATTSPSSSGRLWSRATREVGPSSIPRSTAGVGLVLHQRSADVGKAAGLVFGGSVYVRRISANPTNPSPCSSYFRRTSDWQQGTNSYNAFGH